MSKIIQTRIDSTGDVHLAFSGFVGGECQTEEDRFRRELAMLGLNVDVKLCSKSANSQTHSNPQPHSAQTNAQ
jgi:hypothetical protein